MTTRKSSVPKDVDEYLSDVSDAARSGLEKLRRTIKAAAPKATEGISYRIPVYKHRGMLVGFAAFKNHSSFFVMSPGVMKAHREELKVYDTEKGTIHFPLNKSLPAALVKKLVRARMAENEARRKV
jgi:uncharacterized protein YdhG (YjbR/CyaY superfamily)